MDTPVSESSDHSETIKPSGSSLSKEGYSLAKRYETDSPIFSKLYDREDVNCTPSTLHKVKTWINSLNKLNNDSVNSNSDEGDLDFYGFDNKSNNKHTEDEVRQYRRPCITSPNRQSEIKKHSHPKAIKRKKVIELDSHSSSKSNKSEFDDPLSPESEKKKELCSYLQLMKPTDKKTVMILQNRRSVRVKNLSMLQEKRDLEKKLRDENSETTHENDELKLDIYEDERVKDTFNNGCNDDGFKFPAPQKSLLKTFCDFSEEMDGDWFKGWKTQSIDKTCMVNGNSAQTSNRMEESGINGHNDQSSDEFKLPKPPPLFSKSVCDFAEIIQKEVLPFGDVEERLTRSKSPSSKSQVNDKNVTEVKLSIPFSNLGGDFLKSQPTALEEKFSSPLITKVISGPNTLETSLVDSTKSKKRKLKNRKFQSSFKIKLVPKKKSSPMKLNSDTATQKTELVKVKKENLKVQSDLKKKEVKLNDELPKVPLKDNNQDLLPHEKCFAAKQLPHKEDESTVTKEPQSRILAIFTYKEGTKSQQTPSETKTEFLSQIMDIEKSSDDEDTTSLNGRELNSRSSPVTSVHSPEPLEQCTVPSTPFIAFNNDKPDKPLHGYLTLSTKPTRSAIEPMQSPGNWVLASPSSRQKRDQHSIRVEKTDGQLLKIFYVDFNLIVCQEYLVSFWTQTALGNVLGSQNMWLNKGSVQRLSMSNKCTLKESLEMVISTETNFAYLELWTKEHQSEIREGPVADIFAVVYFWTKGRNCLEKKVLQLENIKGFADDVQYSVLKSTPRIIVSWHLTSSEPESKKTFVHCYQLTADFQSVGNISEFEAVEHYVSSLHNIEGCDTLVMGCGENKITLWNLDRGYVLATIEMLDIKSPLSTLWVKCDRGFLFTLQQCVDKELRLIAIHGMNHSWKKLASYVPPDEYDRLKGVCVENGVVVACYDQGIVCWNAHTAETILESPQSDAHYISGKYIITITNDQVNLKHAITFLLSAEDQSL